MIHNLCLFINGFDPVPENGKSSIVVGTCYSPHSLNASENIYDLVKITED